MVLLVQLLRDRVYMRPDSLQVRIWESVQRPMHTVCVS